MSLISEEEISEEELVDCLEKHCLSYSDIKYFQVDRNGKLSKKWGFEGRERQILYCLAVALIKLNAYEMAKHGYKSLLGHSLEQEMPEEELINSAEIYDFCPLTKRSFPLFVLHSYLAPFRHAADVYES